MAGKQRHATLATFTSLNSVFDMTNASTTQLFLRTSIALAAIFFLMRVILSINNRGQLHGNSNYHQHVLVTVRTIKDICLLYRFSPLP